MRGSDPYLADSGSNIESSVSGSMPVCADLADQQSVKEEMLGKMAELLDTAVSWGLKTLLGMVVGLQVVRGLIAPVMDTLKRSALGRQQVRCREWGMQ